MKNNQLPNDYASFMFYMLADAFDTTSLFTFLSSLILSDVSSLTSDPTTLYTFTIANEWTLHNFSWLNEHGLIKVTEVIPSHYTIHQAQAYEYCISGKLYHTTPIDSALGTLLAEITKE